MIFGCEMRLQYTIDDEPCVDDKGLPGLAHISHKCMPAGTLATLVSGYLVGLSKELRATTDKHLAWMENNPEPDRAIYIERGLTKRRLVGLTIRLAEGAWGVPVARSRRSGVRLPHGRRCCRLAASGAGEPALAPQARATRRNYMSIHLATALAGRCAADRSQNL